MSEDTQDREEKNQVFRTEAPEIARTLPADVKHSSIEESFGIEIPVENAPLPSLGKVYPSDTPLYGRQTLQIKSMTAREEDILTSRAYIKDGTVMTKLIESCLLDKSIDVERMLSGDRNALMVAIRVTGYGTEYAVEVSCPLCDQRSKQEFNLAELEVKHLPIEPVVLGANVFEYALPLSGKVVQFRFLTGEDEREIMVTSDRSKKQGVKSDNMITSRLKKSIVAFDGVRDRTKLSMLVERMPARDSRSLRKYIDDNEPGLDMHVWMNCGSCLESSKVRLPMGASFFWPDAE